MTKTEIQAQNLLKALHSIKHSYPVLCGYNMELVERWAKNVVNAPRLVDQEMVN